MSFINNIKKELGKENPQCLRYMVENLIDENMILRRDGTRLKLVMTQIIEDLEKAGNNEKYVAWIKENCNIDLYSNDDLEELKYINRKRTMEYIDKKRIVRDALNNASHSYEYTAILSLSKDLGIDISDLYNE